MALNFNNFETVLQTKLDTITDEKDMLLLGKAIEATVGNVTVSEIQAEAAIQKSAVTAEGGTQISAVQAQGTSERSQINAMSSGFATTSSLSPVATSGSAADLSNLRTVGGQSIAGVGGDIATLPNQSGASGKVLKSDGTTAAWGTETVPTARYTLIWSGNHTSNASITTSESMMNFDFLVVYYDLATPRNMNWERTAVITTQAVADRQMHRESTDLLDFKFSGDSVMYFNNNNNNNAIYKVWGVKL
jgi:hypothetical protein